MLSPIVDAGPQGIFSSRYDMLKREVIEETDIYYLPVSFVEGTLDA